MMVARLLVLLLIGWLGPAMASADSLPEAFETHAIDALSASGPAADGLADDIGAALGPTTSMASLDRAFEHWRGLARESEAARDRAIGGDGINVRSRRRHPGNTMICMWFLFVSEPHRSDAIADGIYGVTWVLRFGFGADDTLDDVNVELLVERL